MKDKLVESIKEAIREIQLEDSSWDVFNVEEISVEVDYPKNEAFGDFTTNIAMVLASRLKRNPKEIAEKIAEAIKNISVSSDARDGEPSLEEHFLKRDIEKAEVVMPGYINFYLSRNVFSREIQNVLSEGDDYGKNDTLEGRKIMIEYTQPNPFKPFHIGHLMSNAIGESISRLIEFSGAQIVRANYQGDVGLHVPKVLWAVMNYDYDVNNIDSIGKAYAFGHKKYEVDEVAKEEIKNLSRVVYEKSDPKVMEIYEQGKQVTLDRFEEIYKILGTKFDQYYFESETWEEGKKIVEDNLGTIFEKSEGAIIFDGEKHGLHKRVFINSQGLTTYEAKEIGLAFLKERTCPSDLYVTVTAVEQERYFQVVRKALEMVDDGFTGKLKHIPHGMMQLSEGKMSSRKGNVVTGESIIEEARDIAYKKTSERVGKDSEQGVVDAVAVAGIKFSILKQSLGKNIAYDPQTSISFEGDSGPYLQYTYARSKSVLEKAEILGITTSLESPTDEFVEVERLIIKFDNIVLKAQEEYSPHHVSNYLIDLAREFNACYANSKIIDKNDINSSAYRVAVTKAVSQVIRNGLFLLGIKVPEKM
ncbi:arginine--tRNA ligase [Patescibacteria group bacterium]